MRIDKILPDGSKMSANEYSPLTLAFIGDGVYELFVRAKVVGSSNASPDKLHKEAVKHVKAKAQSDAIKLMLPYLSEEELWIFKRGRNAKSATSAKNADIVDYRHATGFETLLGYLYLDGREDRILELCEMAFNIEK